MYVIAAMTALALLACGDSLPCVEVDTACAPLYPPTFEQVYANTLQPTCAGTGSTCHTTSGAKGDLIFADIDQSYDMLLGNSGYPARIDLNDPGCSPMLKRIDNIDSSAVMPPGEPLPDNERCAIRQWIAAGANR